jgi:hypothetical protein
MQSTESVRRKARKVKWEMRINEHKGDYRAYIRDCRKFCRRGGAWDFN